MKTARGRTTCPEGRIEGCPDTDTFFASETGDESETRNERDALELLSYACGAEAENTCDSFWCGFNSTLTRLEELCGSCGTLAWESTRACIPTFNECLLAACPPGAAASSRVATRVTALLDQADVWYNPGRLMDVENVTAIQYRVATNPQAATPFDFCVSGLYALFEEERVIH